MHLHKVILLGLPIVVTPWTTISYPALGQHAQSIPSHKPSAQSFTEVQKNSLQLVESMMRDVVTLDLKKTPPMTFIEKYGTFWSHPEGKTLYFEQNNWPVDRGDCQSLNPNTYPCPGVNQRQWNFDPRGKTLFRSANVVARDRPEERQMFIKTVFYTSGADPADRTTIKGMKKWFGDVFSPSIVYGEDGNPHGSENYRVWTAKNYQLKNLKNHRFNLVFYSSWNDPAKGDDNAAGLIKFEYTLNKK
jgi:hypothetical protein